MIKPIELIADYWVLIDDKTQNEYKNKQGDNLVFDTKAEAKAYISALLTTEEN